MKLAAAFLLSLGLAFGQAIYSPTNPASAVSQYMHYAGTWSSGNTYNAQDLVIYNGASYVSLFASNVGNTPSNTSLFWVQLPGGGGGGAWGSITGTLSSQTDLQTALNGKEPTITAGTTPQYWRGDKTWQTLNTTAVAEGTNLYFTNARAQSAMAGLYENPLTFNAPLSRATNTISLSMWGSGTKPVAASALGTNGNCAQWTASGLGDTGSPCGSGGSGANALGYYLVTQSTNAPANAVNVGALSTGLLKLSVTGGVATPSIGAAGTDYQSPISGAPGTWPSTFAPSAHNLLSTAHGDTVAASPVLGDILYGNATPAWTKLAGNTTTTRKFLRQTGTGTISAVPAWDTVTAADVGLGNVTNDAQTKAAIVPNTAPSAGQVLVGNAGGTAYAPQAMSGDCALSSAGAITCTKTGGTAFGAGATATDAERTTQNQSISGNRTYTGTQDASGAGHTLPAKVGVAASKPATCTTGEMYFATDATAGQNWYYCTATNTWTQQLNSGGGSSDTGINCGDSGSICFVDLMCPGSTGVRAIGGLGWDFAASGGSVGLVTPGAGAGLCGYSVTTAASSGSTGSFWLNAIDPLPPINAETRTIYYVFDITLPSTITIGGWYVGLDVASNSTSITDGGGHEVGVRYLVNSACSGATATDTNWTAMARNGGAWPGGVTSTDMGVAATANTEYLIRFALGTSGQVGVNIKTGTGNWLASDVILNTNLPTTGVGPTVRVQTCEAVAKSITFNAWMVKKK